jgi:DNA-binding winged helix-turn-helix (wHTH) protein/tetratricopeptide (TPR) repeat protein
MDKSLHSTGVRVFGRFRLDPMRRLLLRDGEPVTLSPRLLDMLIYLVENPGRVVEKDELMNAVWPGRFVEESNISQTVFHLRKALGDSGEEDRLIATAPGRGYRFCVPVTVERGGSAEPEAPAPPPATPPGAAKPVSGAARYAIAVSAAALLLAGLAFYVFDIRQTQRTATPNAVVVADFQNLTGDPTLGTVLGKVLEIDLAQSPFLNLLSPQQVSETLRLMERPKGEALSPKLAQEVCARNQAKAVLAGTVAALGSRYVVTLEATDCVSGKSIAQNKAEAGRMEDLPDTLDALTAHLRESLDESLSSIHEFGVPIARATTSSFDALKAFSLGEQAFGRGDIATAVTYLKHAVELDPSFAIAYEKLASYYSYLQEPDLAKASSQKAFALRDRASENEKLWITGSYYDHLGNRTEAARSYQLLTRIYPQDWRPWINLTDLYTGMARYDDAIAAGKQALRLNPAGRSPYIMLAHTDMLAGRPADAAATCRQAIARGIDGFDIHELLYEAAFVQGDATTMARQVAGEKGKQTEKWMLDSEAWADATVGRVKRARELFAQAISEAQSQSPEDREDVGALVTDEIQMLAVLGLSEDARNVAATTPGLEAGDDTPFALALAGDVTRAETLAMSKSGDVVFNRYDLPIVTAAIALDQGRPKDAIGAIPEALSADARKFDEPSLLGQAYLETNAPDRAAAEYRGILEHRGEDALSPQYPLAWLGLARALHMQGETTESRAAYEKLFAFWKNADSDLPLLQQAKTEYAKL